MAVSDPSSVDTIAERPDGRLLMAMTEDRRYTGGNVTTMVEELRQKLNNYVYMIRSGQLRESVGAAVDHGVEIRLFCMDEPPAPVREMIRMAGDGLAGEDVIVDWTVHPPTIEEVLQEIATILMDLAPAGWEKVELSASLVGNGLTGACTAAMATGEEVLLQPVEELTAALQTLKAAYWSPERGTWISFYGRIANGDFFPGFGVDQPPPNGPEEFPPEDWAAELERYPRHSVPDWWQAQLTQDHT